MTDKNYMVLDSNGNELKTVKSLSIAKKLANTEKGSVVCDGECVYQCRAGQAVEPETQEKPTEPEKPTKQENPAKPEPKPIVPETYRIKELMNVRAEPSLNAQKLGTISPGTEVTVIAVKDNWLHLTDGTYILFDSGKFAERLCSSHLSA